MTGEVIRLALSAAALALGYSLTKALLKKAA